MLRKWLATTLAALIFATSPVMAQTADLTIVDKTVVVEKTLFGIEQTGSLIERLTKLEKEVYGAETKDSLLAKAEKLHAYSKESSTEAPSLIVRLNSIEWALTHNQTTEPAKGKLERLEQLLLGTPATGSIDSRVAKLAKLSYAETPPEATKVTFFQDTLIKIKLLSSLDTKKNAVGEVFSYQSAEDVYVDGTLVIAKGANGTGKILKVQQARNFGRDAKLDLSFDTIQAFDGTIIDTHLGEKAKEETKSLAKAAGATVAGLVILGPIGVVGGAFVHGKNVVIPAGAELYIQTKQEAPVFGIKVK